MRTDLLPLGAVAVVLVLLAAAPPALAEGQAEGPVDSPAMRYAEASPVDITSATPVHDASATLAPAKRGRLSIQVPVEVDIVGLVVGSRPSILFRPMGPRGSFTIRGAVGVLAGAEYLYVPVNIGVRSVIVPKKKVHPYFGAGFELQSFWVNDAPPVARPAIYVEAGLLVDIGERAGIFFELAPDIAFVKPGFGLSLRLGVQFNPPPRAPAVASR